MQAGNLRQRIAIESLPSPRTRDSFGDTAPVEDDDSNWTEFASRRAEHRPLPGSERFDAAREYGKQASWFSMRYVAGVNTKMRVVWGTRKFNIISVENPDQRRRETLLMVTEIVSSGLPTDA